MLKYIINRVLQAIPTLFIVITVSFFLMRLAPGGPFDGERPLPPEIEANLKQAYGLDKPLLVQYGLYLDNLAHGDLGPSFRDKDHTVNEQLSQGLPASVAIGLCAMALALAVGLPLGILAALRRNRFTDYVIMGAALGGIALPNFVLAPLMAVFFGIVLRLLPVSGWPSVGDSILSYAWYMTLPVIALSIQQIAYIARMMRASMIEVMGQPFIRTAQAKGLSTSRVILRHALRPALLPILSYLGPAITSIITGSVVIEKIFAVPGIGAHFVEGATNRDYTLVMGTVVLYAALIIAMNLLVDVLYSLLDPQVRYRS